MKKILHPAATRGTADYGWLQARYSFSFANFFDPNRIQFGKLRVLNDDIVAPAMGFGKHPHQNMEIVTIPQEGALKHRDSMGNEGIIESGDIQIMSAGSGVEHSEINARTNESVKLFQIWVFPEEEGVTPRYDQKKIAPLLKPNEISTVVKPKSEAGESELWVHQQAWFSLGEFSETTKTTYSLNNKTNGVYIFVIDGTIVADNETLNKRDAIGIWDTDTVTITAGKESRVLLIEIPMN
ncbi:MAG: pirin family protein [Bacteroidia bacterium]|nr:pirin family protein [Bacteroidia bacterium]NNF31177.1 pirin family protein [Flavobacteriaceae bacterium]MBT8274831.1 pirin family protein [Bacteroidia bacterium]NNJ81379.1 pirin family protein [Flavobacteriaceae bacterium]NNK54607.1 pirin family protein [Flavobacteriaceae bacterium]